MLISTTCPDCRELLEIDGRYAGREIRCGRCGNVFQAVDNAAPPVVPATTGDDPFDFREPDPSPRPHRPRRRYDPNRADRYPGRRPTDGGMGIAAVVTGAVGILTWWCPPVGLIAGGMAVIFGGMGLKTSTRPLAVVGIVLGMTTVTFSLGCGVLYGVAVSQQEDFDEFPANNNRRIVLPE